MQRQFETNPFPHEDGAPASWQDFQDMHSEEVAIKESQKTLRSQLKMLSSMFK